MVISAQQGILCESAEKLKVERFRILLKLASWEFLKSLLENMRHVIQVRRDLKG